MISDSSFFSTVTWFMKENRLSLGYKDKDIFTNKWEVWSHRNLAYYE